ncbi:MAG: tetratricopeptide repeat protein [Acidobacteriota bacterium]|nr:tetratricopeptide repeat protein [Acidobacteriota bacterium]
MERIAILPFDNLTGDATLDWVSMAAPAMLAEELAGASRVLAVRVNTVGTAALAGATELLHCTYTQRGGTLEISYALEDAERHRMVSVGSAPGTVLFAVSTLARALDTSAQPFSTPSADAAAAWGRGEFERAVMLDPDFGAAWESWIAQVQQSGKPDAAEAIAERALARSSLWTPLNKARIQLSSALLRRDETARIAALTELARLTPRDSGTLLALAEIEQRNRRFPAAEEFYRRALAIDPANGGALNGLGYAQGEAGDIDGAKKTLEQYGQKPEQAINALDSLGEVHFMNGRFADAEKYFAQASARQANFLNGGPLMKAAYAHWLGGDLAGADALMQKYLANQNDQKIVWRQAVWFYATGRRDQALAMLDKAPADQAAAMDRQRSVWRGEVHPPEDLQQLKKIFESTNPAGDGLPRILYAAALATAGKTEEARALVKIWPLPETAADPLLQSLLYPRFLELRKTLGVR